MSEKFRAGFGKSFIDRFCSVFYSVLLGSALDLCMAEGLRFSLCFCGGGAGSLIQGCGFLELIWKPEEVQTWFLRVSFPVIHAEAYFYLRAPLL